MANVLVEKQSLIDTADAIRAKLGTQALIAPEDFDDRISEISGGGDYGTVTIGALSYTSSVWDYSRCTVSITDADEFYEAALEKGWLYVSTDGGDIVGQVDFQHSDNGWYVQDDYHTTYTEADLSQMGLSVTLDAGETWANFGIRYVFSVDTTTTTQLGITEKVDFLSLGYLKTKFNPNGGGMGHSYYPSDFSVNGNRYLRIQIISYAAGTDIDEIPDCFLAESYNLASANITGATKIGSCFMYGCLSFDNTITIPSTVTEIGESFMSNCTAFDHPITFPASVAYIGDSCLDACESLNSTVSILGPVTQLRNFLSSCTSFNQSITIPNTVTYIDGFMTYCTSFNQPITIPSSVTEIKTFLNSCTAFNQPITIPNSVVSIYGFVTGCSIFNNPITIPSSVKTLKNSFYNMDAFNSAVTFSEGLEYIYYVFYNCPVFNQAITLPSSMNEIGDYCLVNCPAFNSAIDFGGTTKLGQSFMDRCSSFNRNITIPSTITTLNAYSFMYRCHAMVSTVYVETSATVSANQFAFSTTSTSVPAYSTGIKVGGTYGATWRSTFVNRTSSPYRKLIAA